MAVRWKTQKFEELSNFEIYEILAFRSEVFIVEQTCVYNDVDGQDFDSIHISGYEKEKLIAYARIVPAQRAKGVSIGRVLVRNEHRGNGIGHELMKHCLAACEFYFQGENLEMSAQKHLQDYYTKHGFVRDGDPYLEDGIPHVLMRKVLKFE